MAPPTSRRTPIALTVAGSDSGGGAGIQADLKVFHALGVFGTSAITCVTAQNPAGVSAVQPIRAAVVTAQLDRIFAAFTVGAAKTGMLYNAAVIEAVSDAFRRRRFRPVVVDPVMVATSGAMLLRPAAVANLRRHLLPLAAVVTPNVAEAEVLAGRAIRSVAGLRETARALSERYGVPFLLKGGHRPAGGRVVDVLCDKDGLVEFTSRHVRGINPHGAGCTFAAAIAAHLARGCTLRVAVARAKRLITRALARPLMLGRYQALRV
ncbi:bifunctional hydroxymethylpyrimidine kinase/phosphomethylpyrimidine kinase [bacterium]|nr:bifunctional hydroxymethylpyrimidine kinase/phosphomethylpyrimidine kinase [bacterium]